LNIKFTSEFLIAILARLRNEIIPWNSKICSGTPYLLLSNKLFLKLN